MEIECGYQSNCSELVVRLGEPSPQEIYDILVTIQRAFPMFTLCMQSDPFISEYWYHPIKDLKLMRFIETGDETHLRFPLPKPQGEPEMCRVRLVREKISGKTKGHYGDSVSFVIGDYAGYRNDFFAMCGDCDSSLFPMLSALSEIFGGEVNPYDGGHDDNFQDWQRYWDEKGDSKAEPETDGPSYEKYPPIKWRRPE